VKPERASRINELQLPPRLFDHLACFLWRVIVFRPSNGHECFFKSVALPELDEPKTARGQSSEESRQFLFPFAVRKRTADSAVAVLLPSGFDVSAG